MLTTQTRAPTSRRAFPGRRSCCPAARMRSSTSRRDAGSRARRRQWRYADARVEEIDFVEVGHPDDPLGPG